MGAAVVAEVRFKDRFGLGWRPEYAANILMNIDKIDIIEIIGENFVNDKHLTNSLKTLATQIPISIHCVSLGLASSLPVNIKRIEKMAKLFDVITPVSWSEHFAFVRSKYFEIGHLAAPPRNEDTIKGSVKNINVAKEIIGSLPFLENIATLVSPPCSVLSEAQWINQIVQKSSAGILLDLHNLLANSYNFKFCPIAFLDEINLNMIYMIHLSGGRYIENPIHPEKVHLLDDHLHDIPEEIYNLLTIVAEKCPNDLTVIIERDGCFPSFNHILFQLNKSKLAIQKGRNNAHLKRKYEDKL